MSFRLADLKKTVRKGKEGYQVTAARLEGRQQQFRIEFLLEQFEQHLGQPRRNLDPAALLDFVGDVRMGRGLLATLSQWYRMRPRSFAEVLEAEATTRRNKAGARRDSDEEPGKERDDGLRHLACLGIGAPAELRAWLYAAVNRGGGGFLSPADEMLFWKIQARALGVRREVLEQMMVLDRAEEAMLVRTGPRPTAADVAAAYNARAHTTLIRSCSELSLRCDGRRADLESALATWAAPLEVESRLEGSVATLLGRADALGCWTRHGRTLERVALELFRLPELKVREVRGRLGVGERDCTFCWKEDTLTALGMGSGQALRREPMSRIEALASLLRREREQGESKAAWSVRRPGQLIGVEGSTCLPHLEVRLGDLALYLRVVDGGLANGGGDPSFTGKTPVAWIAEDVSGSGFSVQFAGQPPHRCEAQELGGVLYESCTQMAATLRRNPAIGGRRLSQAA